MIDVVMVGAGQRGRHVYGAWMLRNPDRARCVAVVEPDDARRHAFAADHGIPPDRRYRNVAELWEAERLATACIVATPDRVHPDHATGALARGYEVLMEKPMAPTLAAAAELVERAATAPGRLHVAHVLRYAPHFRALHRLVASGAVGDITAISHRENIWAFHMAHSFVRGNWSRAAESTPMIVAKSCHDLDILSWLLAAPVTRLSSFGSLMHFRPDQAPPGATARCTDGCPVRDCPFDARRIYLDPDVTGWPVETITEDPTMEGRRAALADGPYGVCVYRAGSDVVDHQTVTLEAEDGSVASFVMQGHSDVEQRTTRIDGTRGTIRATTGPAPEITVTDHVTARPRPVELPETEGEHGGGDDGLMRAFVEAAGSGAPGPTEAAGALESHLLAFLAEEARISGAIVDVTDRRNRLEAP